MKLWIFRGPLWLHRQRRFCSHLSITCKNDNCPMNDRLFTPHRGLRGKFSPLVVRKSPFLYTRWSLDHDSSIEGYLLNSTHEKLSKYLNDFFLVWRCVSRVQSVASRGAIRPSSCACCIYSLRVRTYSVRRHEQQVWTEAVSDSEGTRLHALTHVAAETLRHVPGTTVVGEWESLDVNPFTPRFKKYILPTF